MINFFLDDFIVMMCDENLTNPFFVSPVSSVLCITWKIHLHWKLCGTVSSLMCVCSAQYT